MIAVRIFYDKVFENGENYLITQKNIGEKCMSVLQRQIEALEKKKEKINSQIKSLVEKRNQKLLMILNRDHNAMIDPDIIAGGLLYVCENASNPTLAKQWRETGRKFCRPQSKSKSESSQKTS